MRGNAASPDLTGLVLKWNKAVEIPWVLENLGAELSYSKRNAVMGSIRLARCAGIMPAAVAINDNNKTIPTTICGSCAWMP